MDNMIERQLGQAPIRRLFRSIGEGKAYTSEFDDDERNMFLKASRRMGKCGRHLKWRTYFGEQPFHRIVDGRFCGLSYACPICAARRQWKQAEKGIPRVQGLQGAFPDLSPYLLTLTMPTGPDLRFQLDLLASSISFCFERARKHRHNPDRHPYTEFVKIRGAMLAIEIKRSKGNRHNWHVHAHAFILTEQEIDRAKLVEEWKALTGGHQVDLRPIEDLGGGYAEAIKYPVKFSDMEPVDIARVMCAVRGTRGRKAVRLIRSYGLLRGPQFDEPDLNEFEEEEIHYGFQEFSAIWDVKRSSYRYDFTWGASGQLVEAQIHARKDGLWTPAPLHCLPEESNALYRQRLEYEAYLQRKAERESGYVRPKEFYETAEGWEFMEAVCRAPSEIRSGDPY